jgi:hypothetical protein
MTSARVASSPLPTELGEQTVVERLLPHVSEERIRETIVKLSEGSVATTHSPTHPPVTATAYARTHPPTTTSTTPTHHHTRTHSPTYAPPIHVNIGISPLLDSSLCTWCRYLTRHYTTALGVQSSEWIASEFARIAAEVGRSKDVEVVVHRHSAFPQPSIIAKIKGTDLEAETIVIGAHADSVAGTS